MDNYLVCDSLGKRYGAFDALRDCSLTVRRGEVFGLLGPNGAGKTTLLRLLLGFLQPTSGHATIDGCDVVRDGIDVRRRVTYLPGDARLPQHFRGQGLLRFFAEMHPCGNYERSLDVARRLELDLRRHVAFMSTGMRQKLALAVVLGTSAPLLILDEPTANLDPTVRARVLRYVLDASDEGRTVIFSSHVLSEIEQTCNRVVFLKSGQLVRTSCLRDLAQRHRITALATSLNWSIPESLRPLVELSQRSDSHLPISVTIDTTGDLALVLPWIASLPLSQVRIEPIRLQNIYDEVHFACDNPHDSQAGGKTCIASS